MVSGVVQPSTTAIKTLPEIIKQASQSPLGIFALMIVALSIISYAFFKSAKPKVKISIFFAMLAGVVAYGVAISRAASATSNAAVYRVRVIVLSSQGTPVDDSRVWSSAGGEAMRVEGGWQFVIPAAAKPADGRVTVYAQVTAAFLTGQTELQLADDYNPTVKVQLSNPRLADVQGIVEDSQQRAIPGASVGVVGYDSEAQLTKANGGCRLMRRTASRYNCTVRDRDTDQTTRGVKQGISRA